MLNLSKSERYLIFTFLIIGTFWLGYSYHKKINSPRDIKAVRFKEPASFININTASMSQLESLPGIGPILADNIIIFREEVGGFDNIEELKDVKGISNKKFEEIKDLVTIFE